MRRSDAPAARPQVILHHTPTCWLAEFRGPIADDMKDLVGSETVPTGFNGHVPAAVVRHAIALLNPDAAVTVAGAPAAASLALVPLIASEQSIPRAAPMDEFLNIAASVVAAATTKPRADVPAVAAGRPGRQKPERPPMAAERPISPHLERALKIRKSLGIVVASRYLKKRGWTFEAAHRILLATWPRKLEACVPQSAESQAAATKVRTREVRVVVLKT
jgi:hypothetical protein